MPFLCLIRRAAHVLHHWSRVHQLHPPGHPPGAEDVLHPGNLPHAIHDHQEQGGGGGGGGSKGAGIYFIYFVLVKISILPLLSEQHSSGSATQSMPTLPSSASNPGAGGGGMEAKGGDGDPTAAGAAAAAGQRQQHPQHPTPLNRVGIKRLSWRNGRRMFLSASRSDSSAAAPMSHHGDGGKKTGNIS